MIDIVMQTPDRFSSAVKTALEQAGRLSAVLYHDLRRDMHRACQIIMQAHGALDGPIVTSPAPIQVITPFNVPPEAMAWTSGEAG